MINLAGFAQINPAFSIIKLMCLMIHTQYMVISNTSPTYFCSYLRNASLQRVKAIVDTKTFCLHTSQNNKKVMRDPPFAKVQNTIHTRALHVNAVYTQATIGNTTYVRTLPDKNILNPHFRVGSKLLTI